LIQKYSDLPETYSKGDTGFFSVEGKPGQIDPGIMTAAFALENIGDISNAVIEADDGYHILMQNGKRAAYNRPFDQAEKELKRRIINAEVQKRRDEFILELKAKANININEKAVAQIEEKIKSERKRTPPHSENR